MVKLNNTLKSFVSCCLVLLQAYTGWCQTLSPSVVQIRQDTRYLCAGTLTRRNLAITAAHCLPNGNNFTGVTVLYGVAPGTSSAVNRIGIHPSYNAFTRANDAAALALVTAAPDTVPVAPRCTQSWQHGAQIFVYAWNFPADVATTVSPRLNTLTFSVYNRDWCRIKYPTKVNVGHLSHFCGYDAVNGPCFRDRGGPIEYNGQFCGIMSYAFLCTSANLPGVFTNTGSDGIDTFLLQQLAL